jgi:VWFA-related protein
MLLIAMMLCSWPELSAQDKKPPKSRDDEVIRVDTELVEVPVVVTDRAGKPILDLKQSNFTVSEDGKLQQITDFSTSSAPFEVALLLDTSGSTRGELQLIQRAAQSFISSLRPGTGFSIIAYQTDASNGKSSPKSELIAN